MTTKKTDAGAALRGAIERDDAGARRVVDGHGDALRGLDLVTHPPDEVPAAAKSAYAELQAAAERLAGAHRAYETRCRVAAQTESIRQKRAEQQAERERREREEQERRDRAEFIRLGRRLTEQEQAASSDTADAGE